jgi:hypothetical protein
MTATTTISPPSQTATGPANPIHPSDVLMNLIVTLLAPAFLSATGGDIGLARMAAIDTINAYRAQNQADLIAVSQIAAYGLAALGSLSLSMANNLSLSMTLRLRGNANALTRSAEQNRRALQNTRNDSAPLHDPAFRPEPEAPATTRADEDPHRAAPIAGATAAQLAAKTRAHDDQVTRPTTTPAPAPIAATIRLPSVQEQRNQKLWASAMLKEAEKLRAGMRKLPPAERSQASHQAATLATTASSILVALGGPPLPIPAHAAAHLLI